jgi:hypothetical protein
LRVPTTFIELPVEGKAVAFLLCTAEEEPRVVCDLTNRDVIGDVIDALAQLFDALACDDEGSR